jgi:DNA-binding response OmpR family regulator
MENPFEEPCIFVVDEEDEIAKIFPVVLQMNLFNAVPYFDPQEALDAAQQSPSDYLLTDVMMPGMDGRQGCRTRVQDVNFLGAGSFRKTD